MPEPDDRLNNATETVQIRVHGVDGSIQTFTQRGGRLIGQTLNWFQPTYIFVTPNEWGKEFSPVAVGSTSHATVAIITYARTHEFECGTSRNNGTGARCLGNGEVSET